MTLYERTADRIAGMIARGTLRPGERIPSVRRLSREQAISPATVLMAYDLLERRGLVEARPQSGYYVRHAARAVPPGPAATTPRRQPTRVDVEELVWSVLDATRDPSLVPLGSPFPSPTLHPMAALNRTLAAVARRADPAAIARDLPPGHAELRRRIAQRYLGAGCSVDADEIVVTNGAMHAIHLCLRAVAAPGDAVAIESPCFYGLLQALETMGMRAVEVATHPREGIDLGELAALIERHPIRACALMTTFQNPLGSLMPEAKKRELVALLARHDVPLVEDDVYGDLHHGQHRPPPAKAFDRRGLVLHCSSFSKTLAPGYRIGWAAAGRFHERVTRLAFASTLATASLPQAALATYLGNANPDRHLRTMRQHLLVQRDAMIATVTQAFPADTRITLPEGGYQLWVELPGTVDALTLYRQALARDIWIAPGPLFSARRALRHHVRLNYGQPWTPATRTAVATVGRLARDLDRSVADPTVR